MTKIAHTKLILQFLLSDNLDFTNLFKPKILEAYSLDPYVQSTIRSCKFNLYIISYTQPSFSSISNTTNLVQVIVISHFFSLFSS